MAMSQEEREFEITDTRLDDPLTRADHQLAEAKRNASGCLESVIEGVARGGDPNLARALLLELQALGYSLTAAEIEAA